MFVNSVCTPITDAEYYNVDYKPEYQSTAATAVQTGAIVSGVASFMHGSSTQAAFAGINQLQLILLFILLGVYLPKSVRAYIKSISLSFVSLNF